jgi:DNA-binding winged helix-turn-helix (wHTH) protein/tetratricopeptide (TPR) repeat protein
MTLPGPPAHFDFGNFTLRADGTLFHDGTVVPLPPKELEVLRLLLARAGEIVPTDQLRQSAWGSIHVSADSLPRCISSLRARLGSDNCIQTVYKRGYRFNLSVKQTPYLPQPEQEKTEPAANTTPRLPRLAILPLSAGAGVPEFLGPGIAEETMLRLSRLRQPITEVLARDSVFALAARGHTAQEVGRILEADLAVTGAVIALPLYYRLRAEMIRVSDAVQLWVEDFMVPRNLLASADALIAKRIGARIRTTFASCAKPLAVSARAALTAQTVPAVPVVPEHSARHSEAYAAEMRAIADWETFRLPQMQDAVRGFQRALELNPGLHSARIQLMHSYLALSSFGYMRADIGAELARKHAETLLAHSPCGHGVYPTLGWIHFFHDRDLDAAASFFARPLNAGYDPWTPVYRARFALGQGRFSDAVALLRSALAIDPFSSALHWRLAWALHLAGDAAPAIEQSKRTLHLFPNDPCAMFFASTIFATACGGSNGLEGESGKELGQCAVAIATRLIETAPCLDPAYAALAYAYARQGKIVEARALLDRQKGLAGVRFVMRSIEAPALVELGEHDAAMEVLTTAEKQHCPWLFELLGDPRLKPLHREPEFHRLGRLSGHLLTEKASVA